MTAGPLLLVSKSVRALLPYWHGPLGQLFTPRMLTGLDITEGCGIPWAADNDCFHGFDPGRYLDLLEAISYRSGCLFVAAPDVVGDATATLALFERWQPVLQSVWATVDEGDVEPGQPVHQPVALVAQDGLERLPVPWEHLQALFIGGSTRWKLGPHAAALIRQAKQHGKWVHVGRVNTLRRIQWFKALEIDSIDGSGFARFTRARLPMGIAALTGPTQQTLLSAPSEAVSEHCGRVQSSLLAPTEVAPASGCRRRRSAGARPSGCRVSHGVVPACVLPA